MVPVGIRLKLAVGPGTKQPRGAFPRKFCTISAGPPFRNSNRRREAANKTSKLPGHRQTWIIDELHKKHAEDSLPSSLVPGP